MIKVVTFFTAGPPYDNGIKADLSAYNLKCLVEDQGHEFYAYSPESIKSLGADYLVREFSDDYKLPRNPGFHKIGFGGWKPFVIIDALSKSKKDDVAFYIDCNIAKYPDLRQKIANIKNLVDLALSKHDFFIARERMDQVLLAKHHSSNAQISSIGGGTDFSRNFPLLIANNVIARNSAAALEILHEWLICCSQEKLILPPGENDRDADFKWFCPEQGIINQVVARRIQCGKLPLDYPGIAIGRAFSPRAADNSHIKFMDARYLQNQNQRRFYFSNGQFHVLRKDPIVADSSLTSWKEIPISSHDWQAVGGACVTRHDENAFTIGDDETTGIHTLQTSNSLYEKSRIRMNILIEPEPSCDAMLCLSHSGGAGIVSVDHDGNIALLQNAVSAKASKTEEGFINLDVDFVNLAREIFLSLSSPTSHYKGQGKNHYKILGIKLTRSDLCL